MLPYSDALVIQGYRLPRLVFRKWANRWYQVMYDDTPPMVRPGLRESDDRLHTHALKDCDIFDDAEEICYLFLRDDRQTVWLHMSEIFELRPRMGQSGCRMWTMRSSAQTAIVCKSRSQSEVCQFCSFQPLISYRHVGL